MKAWVIKSKDGYSGGDWQVSDQPLNHATLYPTKKEAQDAGLEIGETIIPVEVKLIKKGKNNA
jgi:hypothetical protein